MLDSHHYGSEHYAMPEHVTFDYYFNGYVDDLPKSIKTINFNGYFNRPIDKLPQFVEYISFGFKFNRHVDNLPKLLKTLIFGAQFCQPVDKLPQFIEYISFGFKFNRCVDNLPKLLKTIIFSTEFCQPVDNLPKYVENITFKYIFNQRLDKLPKSAKLKLFDVVKEEDKPSDIFSYAFTSVNIIMRRAFKQKNSLGIYIKHIEYTVIKNVFEKTNVPFNIQKISILQKTSSKTKFNKLPYGSYCVFDIIPNGGYNEKN